MQKLTNGQKTQYYSNKQAPAAPDTSYQWDIKSSGPEPSSIQKINHHQNQREYGTQTQSTMEQQLRAGSGSHANANNDCCAACCEVACICARCCFLSP